MATSYFYTVIFPTTDEMITTEPNDDDVIDWNIRDASLAFAIASLIDHKKGDSCNDFWRDDKHPGTLSKPSRARCIDVILQRSKTVFMNTFMKRDMI